MRRFKLRSFKFRFFDLLTIHPRISVGPQGLFQNHHHFFQFPRSTPKFLTHRAHGVGSLDNAHASLLVECGLDVIPAASQGDPEVAEDDLTREVKRQVQELRGNIERRAEEVYNRYERLARLEEVIVIDEEAAGFPHGKRPRVEAMIFS